MPKRRTLNLPASNLPGDMRACNQRGASVPGMSTAPLSVAACRLRSLSNMQILGLISKHVPEHGVLPKYNGNVLQRDMFRL